MRAAGQDPCDRHRDLPLSPPPTDRPTDAHDAERIPRRRGDAMQRPRRPKISRLYQLAAVTLVVNALICLKSLGTTTQGIQNVFATRATASAIARVSAA